MSDKVKFSLVKKPISCVKCHEAIEAIKGLKNCPRCGIAIPKYKLKQAIESRAERVLKRVRQ